MNIITIYIYNYSLETDESLVRKLYRKTQLNMEKGVLATKNEVKSNSLYLINRTYYNLFGPREDDSLDQNSKATSTPLASA